MLSPSAAERRSRDCERMARRKHNVDGEPLAPGMVPPEFCALFQGAQETELVPRLRRWLHERYGSPFADLYWLAELAAASDRESVRFDAVRHLQVLFYGEAPHHVMVEEKEPSRVTAPTTIVAPDRRAQLFNLLRTVGALPRPGDAGGAGGSTDSEME